MSRILLVEDEEHLAAGIRFNLELDGYQVETIGDGLRALQRLAPEAPPTTPAEPLDLVLLDVMLPGMDGFRIVERMRRAGNYVPVLMLTAKGLPEDVVEGLERGADDYLPKPFDLPVLLARVKGLIRRRDWTRGVGEEGGGPERVRVGEAEIDFAGFELRRRGECFRLTLLEAMLLRLLVQRRGEVVGKGEILEKVWNLNAETETRAVDNFVMRLRRYLEDDPAKPRLLQTVRGVGYRLADA